MLSGCYCLSTCYPMAQMPILPARRRSSCQRCVHSLTTRILRLILGSKPIAACWRNGPRRAAYQQQGGEERESDDMNRQDLALVMQMIQAMGARNPPFSITLKEAEVQLPEYQPPVIKFEPQIIINVPEQAAPIVNVEVPAQEAPRVIIKTPPQPTPIVNVPPDAS